MLSCVCSVIDHRRRQNVVRTSMTHSAIASCALFCCSYHILTSSVIYYSTNARQHGIYLLTRTLLAIDLFCHILSVLGLDACLKEFETIATYTNAKVSFQVYLHKRTTLTSGRQSYTLSVECNLVFLIHFYRGSKAWLEFVLRIRS